MTEAARHDDETTVPEEAIIPPDARWLTEIQKAAQLQVSVAYLRKDRAKARPTFPFRRFGRLIRYPRS